MASGSPHARHSASRVQRIHCPPVRADGARRPGCSGHGRRRDLASEFDAPTPLSVFATVRALGLRRDVGPPKQPRTVDGACGGRIAPGARFSTASLTPPTPRRTSSRQGGSFTRQSTVPLSSPRQGLRRQEPKIPGAAGEGEESVPGGNRTAELIRRRSIGILGVPFSTRRSLRNRPITPHHRVMLGLQVDAADKTAALDAEFERLAPPFATSLAEK